MKRIVPIILVLAMLLSTGASAFTFEELNPEDIFTPEVIEQEKVSDWARDEIELARQAGLITAHTADYMTHDTTRFQFAELIVNMVEKATGQSIEAAPAATFTDCTEIAVRKAQTAGIVTGVGNGRFAPDTTTNREQIAAMVARANAYIDAQTGSDLAPAAPDIEKFSDKEQVSAWAVDGVGKLVANGIMNGTSATTLSPKDSCTVEQSILLVYRVYQLFVA